MIFFYSQITLSFLNIRSIPTTDISNKIHNLVESQSGAALNDLSNYLGSNNQLRLMIHRSRDTKLVTMSSHCHPADRREDAWLYIAAGLLKLSYGVSSSFCFQNVLYNVVSSLRTFILLLTLTYLCWYICRLSLLLWCLPRVLHHR